jgi:cyclopropane fatty-acyl-phospholipid synthase-like methyltransferase
MSSAARSWDRAYDGTPPWDIGRPQPAITGLAGSMPVGDLVDLGCGTGEHVLFFASRGHRASGIDFSAAAIAKARRKASERGISARFDVADVLKLGSLGRRFDTVIDVGLFHTFEDADRARYVRQVSELVRPEGRYFMLCFSEKEPTDWDGPRRVSRPEIEASLSEGWRIDFIREAAFATKFHDGDGGSAWLAGATRLSGPTPDRARTRMKR